MAVSSITLDINEGSFSESTGWRRSKGVAVNPRQRCSTTCITFHIADCANYDVVQSWLVGWLAGAHPYTQRQYDGRRKIWTDSWIKWRETSYRKKKSWPIWKNMNSSRVKFWVGLGSSLAKWHPVVMETPREWDVLRLIWGTVLFQALASLRITSSWWAHCICVYACEHFYIPQRNCVLKSFIDKHVAH